MYLHAKHVHTRKHSHTRIRAHTQRTNTATSLHLYARKVPRQVFIEVEVETEVIQYVNQIVEKEVIEYEEAKKVAYCLFKSVFFICP